MTRYLAPGARGHSLTHKADTADVTELHHLLGEFFGECEQRDGLGRIFRDFQSWLTPQTWYQFATAEPDQIG